MEKKHISGCFAEIVGPMFLVSSQEVMLMASLMAWGNKVRPSVLFDLTSEEDLMKILPGSASVKAVECGWEIELRNPFGTMVECVSAGDLRRALYAALRAAAKTAVTLEKGYCPWCNRFHRFGHMKNCLWVQSAELFVHGLVSPEFVKVLATG